MSLALRASKQAGPWWVPGVSRIRRRTFTRLSFSEEQGIPMDLELPVSVGMRIGWVKSETVEEERRRKTRTVASAAADR